MIYVLISIFSYLLGSINPAYIFGRIKGFDIRERGSKNAGASNAKLCLGWKYFIICVIFDISKAIISILIIRYILLGNKLMEIVGGCFTIIGHCFPFYLNFKGGKGFASYIGLSLTINYKIFVIIMIIALILAIISNYIVTATMILSFSVPIVAYILKMSVNCIICLILMTTLIVFQHRSNFIKFIHNQEIGINGKTIGLK